MKGHLSKVLPHIFIRRKMMNVEGTAISGGKAWAGVAMTWRPVACLKAENSNTGGSGAAKYGDLPKRQAAVRVTMEGRRREFCR